jgi:ABC-type antimicrobial peptide transport system permease subunit
VYDFARRVSNSAPSIHSRSDLCRRFYVLLLGVFAGIAVILAAIGMYGVISYVIIQRTQEIGIRMALGAARSDVMRLAVRHGVIPALIGILAGLGGAFA